MRLKPILLVIFAFCSIHLSAQSIVQSLRYTAYADFYRGPSILHTDDFGNSQYLYEDGFSYFSILYDARYLLSELSDETAVGIGLTPTIGAYTNTGNAGGTGVGGFSMPIYFSFDYGAGSTFNSTKDFGIGFGIGYQFKKVSLIPTNDFYIEDAEIITSWSQPVANLNIRWWGVSHLNELNFRAGLPQKSDAQLVAGLEAPQSAFHFLISFGRFLNY